MRGNRAGVGLAALTVVIALVPAASIITAAPAGAGLTAAPVAGQRLIRAANGTGGYTLAIKLPALLARTVKGVGVMANATTLNSTSFPVAQTDASAGGGGRAVVYETDGAGKVTDVVVTGRTRFDTGGLIPMQWAVSSSGVELSWSQTNNEVWTIKRNGTSIGTSSSGWFKDGTPPTSAARYEVTREVTAGPVTKPIDYVVVLPPLIRSVIGTTVRSGAAPPDALVVARPGAEVARFLEWNAFIPDQYVPTFGCNLPGSGLNYFAGDNRTFATAPAREAFTATGTPESRVSVRIGSSFATSGTVDLNQTTYDQWFLNQVGTSGGYDAQKRLRALANAGRDEVSLTESRSTATTAFRNVVVDASLPLCKILGVFDAPAISQDFGYLARADGSMLITADFDQAPSTELLWQAGSTPATPSTLQGGCLLRFANRGFELLGSPAQVVASVDLPDPTVSTSCPVLR